VGYQQVGRQPRQCLDIGKVQQSFGFRARMPFEVGLKTMIEQYMQNHQAVVGRAFS